MKVGGARTRNITAYIDAETGLGLKFGMQEAGKKRLEITGSRLEAALRSGIKMSLKRGESVLQISSKGSRMLQMLSRTLYFIETGKRIWVSVIVQICDSLKHRTSGRKKKKSCGLISRGVCDRQWRGSYPILVYSVD